MKEAGSAAACDSLVAQARAGDPEAFRLIFGRHSKPVLAFIYNLLGSRTQAEELLQETFVRAYRRLGTIRDESRLSTWLFGIARNVVREAIKRKYVENFPVSLEELEPMSLRAGGPAPDEPLLTNELSRAIRAALSGLSEDGRAVFVLKIIHNMRYEEISRITGASVGKLKTDLHRARLQMRQRLQRYLGEASPGMRGVS